MDVARVEVFAREVERLASGAEALAEMRRRAAVGLVTAKRLCPVSSTPGPLPPGTLRGSLRSDVGVDGGNAYAAVYVDPDSPAIDYWQFVEFPTRAHSIDSTGPWPLRNKYTDPPQVFGPHVNHPGTQAQPFLRPALDAMRRG